MKEVPHVASHHPDSQLFFGFLLFGALCGLSGSSDACFVFTEEDFDEEVLELELAVEQISEISESEVFQSYNTVLVVEPYTLWGEEASLYRKLLLSMLADSDDGDQWTIILNGSLAFVYMAPTMINADTRGPIASMIRAMPLEEYEYEDRDRGILLGREWAKISSRGFTGSTEVARLSDFLFEKDEHQAEQPSQRATVTLREDPETPELLDYDIEWIEDEEELQEDEDELVLLSPFTVTTDQDVGYYCMINSTGGPRR